ncbi:MAG: hypothetical protein KJ645_07970 [Planctomycetes bacterium]|nr:hypothetical protein [Planctomycetota bacterium]
MFGIRCKSLLVCLIAGTFLPLAVAADGEAGACLIFPYLDTHDDHITIFRITNVSRDTVTVRLAYVDEASCSLHDQWLTLTGRDTITFMGNWVAPHPMRGFLYAHVEESEAAGRPEQADVLIGQELIFSTWEEFNLMCFTLNAMAFKAIDVDPDDRIHLDGSEYEAAPKSILLPGFFGQDFPNAFQPAAESLVILINLTGGKYFSHAADLLVYNDNEQAFSGHKDFPCFALLPLTSLSNATRNGFLLSTNHDPDEPAGFAYMGLETGWISITGNYAVNPDSGAYIDHASLLAVLIDRIGPSTWFAGLPFHEADPSTHDNAMLWSTNPSGN